jgi:hypothetical protein
MTKTCENMNLMSPREKRVAIMKDVIKQVKSKDLIAKTGQYVNKISSSFMWGNTDDKQINEILIEKKIQCEVCARGAIFIAGLKRFNNLKVGDIKGRQFNWDVREEYESNFFEKQQLSLIERVFEREAVPAGSQYALRSAAPTNEQYQLVCKAARTYRK